MEQKWTIMRLRGRKGFLMAPSTGFFLTKFQELKEKKLKSVKTQAKFCPKTQGTGTFLKFS